MLVSKRCNRNDKRSEGWSFYVGMGFHSADNINFLGCLGVVFNYSAKLDENLWDASKFNKILIVFTYAVNIGLLLMDVPL